MDRFSGEEMVSTQCENPSDPAEWSKVTCKDPREFCMYRVESFKDWQYKYTRGCAIPKGE